MIFQIINIDIINLYLYIDTKFLPEEMKTNRKEFTIFKLNIHQK